MPDERKSSVTPEQVREVMRDWETYKMSYDPEFARTYAGEWVVMHRGRVVAHGKKGSEVAQAVNVQEYPGATIFYVPTLEQQEGVWILGVTGSDG
jgi:ABC-type cobalamin/Fe3+-siderophores transport system ATPase subunit